MKLSFQKFRFIRDRIQISKILVCNRDLPGTDCSNCVGGVIEVLTELGKSRFGVQRPRDPSQTSRNASESLSRCFLALPMPRLLAQLLLSSEIEHFEDFPPNLDPSPVPIAIRLTGFSKETMGFPQFRSILVSSCEKTTGNWDFPMNSAKVHNIKTF